MFFPKTYKLIGLAADERGASLAEYAIVLVAIVAIVVIVVKQHVAITSIFIGS